MNILPTTSFVLKFNLIEKSNSFYLTSEHLHTFLCLSIISISVLDYFNIFEVNTSISLSYTILFIGYFIFRSFEFYPRNFKVVSEMSLEMDKVSLDKVTTKMEDIRSIEIKVSDWYGKKDNDSRLSILSGPSSTGINNSITIENDKGLQSLNFQINSKEHFLELSKWVKSLYNKPFLVQETYENRASYGLEHLDYEDIQIFKKQYRIN